MVCLHTLVLGELSGPDPLAVDFTEGTISLCNGAFRRILGHYPGLPLSEIYRLSNPNSYVDVLGIGSYGLPAGSG